MFPVRRNEYPARNENRVICQLPEVLKLARITEKIAKKTD
jgi:hypothetical protein